MFRCIWTHISNMSVIFCVFKHWGTGSRWWIWTCLQWIASAWTPQRDESHLEWVHLSRLWTSNMHRTADPDGEPRTTHRPFENYPSGSQPETSLLSNMHLFFLDKTLVGKVIRFSDSTFKSGCSADLMSDCLQSTCSKSAFHKREMF